MRTRLRTLIPSMRSIIAIGAATWPQLIRMGLCCASLFFALGASADDAELFALLNSGNHFGLMRHSTAPGSDDPPNFRIGDCTTQRNLSTGGREQAIAIGEKLRANGIVDARVVSSQWCRCLDTAELLNIGSIEEFPSLNSLVSYPGQGRAMTQDLTAWIAEQDISRPTLLVTHQINIGSLLRSSAGEGDILIVHRQPDGALTVTGIVRAN